MILYECGITDIIKNAVLFTVAKLPMCVLLGTVIGMICMVLFDFLGIFGIIVYALFGMIFMRYPLEFYAARVIEKNIEKTISR